MADPEEARTYWKRRGHLLAKKRREQKDKQTVEEWFKESQIKLKENNEHGKESQRHTEGTE